MRRVEFGNNQSNQTISNTTDNSTIPIVYALGPPLATISSICIIIGTFFSLLCVYRYFRQANLRTHFTYIFHSMLIYCLISSFIDVPIFLMGYYLNLFFYSHRLCHYYGVNTLSIYIGMNTSLAYASLERNYFIFRKNGLLSFRRQCIPIGCLMIYSYSMGLIIVLASRCPSTLCSSCYSKESYTMFIWLFISFVLPELVMFSSTMLLLLRLYRHRSHLIRPQERNIYYRIVMQMGLYVIWSCFYYCPPTFYNLALLFNGDLISPSTKSAMVMVSTLGVQSYPVLTFIVMTNFHRRMKNPLKKRHRNSSNHRLNVLSTITEPQMDRTR